MRSVPDMISISTINRTINNRRINKEDTKKSNVWHVYLFLRYLVEHETILVRKIIYLDFMPPKASSNRVLACVPERFGIWEEDGYCGLLNPEAINEVETDEPRWWLK